VKKPKNYFSRKDAKNAKENKKPNRKKYYSKLLMWGASKQAFRFSLRLCVFARG